MLKRDVAPPFRLIADALVRQRSAGRVERVSITVTSAFATDWLLPRRSDRGARHPDVEVNLVVSDRYLELDAEGIDIAIRNGPPPSWRPIPHEQIFPVCAPTYRARAAMQAPQVVVQERFLHRSGLYRPEARWRQRSARHDTAPPDARTGIGMKTCNTMLQAAISGPGAALAGYPPVDSYLAEGTGLRPPGHRAPTTALLLSLWQGPLRRGRDNLRPGAGAGRCPQRAV